MSVQDRAERDPDLTAHQRRVLNAHYSCLNNGLRDRLGGGVHATHIHEEITDRTIEWIRTAQRELHERGYLHRVHGRGPRQHGARVSYLPRDHPDAPATDDEEEGLRRA